jgi:hypothetical protein
MLFSLDLSTSLPGSQFQVGAISCQCTADITQLDPKDEITMTLSDAARVDLDGIHFSVDWNGRSVPAVAPHKALYKAQAALARGDGLAPQPCWPHFSTRIVVRPDRAGPQINLEV